MTQVFVSAASDDFESFRQVVRDALVNEGILPRDQKAFEAADHRPLEDFLSDEIANSVAVIHLIGPAYGSEPPVRGVPRRSYTQIEYDLAKQLEKPIFVFLTSINFIPESPLQQGEAERLLQEQHRQVVISANTKWVEFTTPDDLCKQIQLLISKLLSLPTAEVQNLARHYRSRFLHSSVFNEGVDGRPINETPQLHPVWTLARRSQESGTGSLLELVDQLPRLAVVGDGGVGKTLVMKQLAFAAAERCAKDEQARLPVWLAASEFRSDPNRRAWEDFVTVQVRTIVPDGNERSVLDLLKQGRCLTLIDGFDEMRPLYDDRVEAIGEFLRLYPHNRVVISSRPGFLPSDWRMAEVRVPALGKMQQEQLVSFYCAAQVDRFDRWLSSVDSGVAELVDNPFYLSALLELFQADSDYVPKRPGRVLHDVLTERIRTEYGRHAFTGFWRLFADSWKKEQVIAACLQVFGCIGYADLQAGGGMHLSSAALDEAVSQKVVIRGKSRELPKGSGPNDDLLGASEQLGFFTLDEKGEFRFSHRLWRDYLAAERIACQIEAAGRSEFPEQAGASEPEAEFRRTEANQFSLPPVPTGLDENWNSVYRLLPGLLNEEDELRLLDQLLQDNPPLAALCIAEGGAKVSSINRHRFAEAFLFEMQSATLSVPRRMLAARALGRLGDDRLWEDPDRPLVPRLVTVQAGHYRSGLSQTDLHKIYDQRAIDDFDLDEEELQTATSFEPAFSIGKYPVTNAHFKAFIDDGGYRRKEYWLSSNEDEGWRWLQGSQRLQGPQENGGERRLPDYWSDSHYNEPNQPLVGITIFEAEAYCRWLTATVNDGRQFDLPNVRQWQAAARGVDGRLYPWGDQAEPQRCNCWHEAYLGVTSPVGIFPGARTPDGIEDLAGNVAEFCKRAGGEGLALCGGSWLSSISECRTTRTRVCSAELKSIETGFRVAVRSQR
jgi:formylglycine-generating enzyme required for sulfatase activity